MPWSYDKATDTLTVWGGTPEAPITLDDFDGELDISSDSIVILEDTDGPSFGSVNFSATNDPKVGTTGAARLYLAIENNSEPGLFLYVTLSGTNAWGESIFVDWLDASTYLDQRFKTIDEDGIHAYADWGADWSFRIEQREVQLVTKAADGCYVVHCNLVIGNGTDATHLASIGEVVSFVSGKTLAIANNATLQLGEEHEGWGRNGSSWTIKPAANMDMIAAGSTNARLEQYASLLRNESAFVIIFESGTWIARNSVTSGAYKPADSNFSGFAVLAATLDWKRIQVGNAGVIGLSGATIDEFDDVHLHGNRRGITLAWADMRITRPRISEYFDNDYYVESHDSHGGSRTFEVLDPVNNIESPLLNNITAATTCLKEIYTCNLTIVDKDGNPVEGVSVKCYDKDDNLVFEAVTRGDTYPDEHGTIAEQEIVYKQWEKIGAAATAETCYTPHKFTFEREGYQTLVMPDVSVDTPIHGGINWRVPLMEPDVVETGRRGLTYIGPWQ